MKHFLEGMALLSHFGTLTQMSRVFDEKVLVESLRVQVNFSSKKSFA